MTFPWTHFSNLSRSLDGIPSFRCVCTTQVGVTCKSLPMSLMKTLNNTDPDTDPWGGHPKWPFSTGVHQDSEPLNATLHMWLPNHFLIHLTHQNHLSPFWEESAVGDCVKGFINSDWNHVTLFYLQRSFYVDAEGKIRARKVAMFGFFKHLSVSKYFFSQDPLRLLWFVHLAVSLTDFLSIPPQT